MYNREASCANLDEQPGEVELYCTAPEHSREGKWTSEALPDTRPCPALESGGRDYGSVVT